MSRITQNQNTTSWMLQGPNGQPQMVKIVQPGKSNIVSSSVSGPIKLLKSGNLVHSSQQGLMSNQTHQQTIRTITPNSKIICKQSNVHVTDCTCVSNISKGPKTIRLTQAQVQNFVPQTHTRVLPHSLTSQAIPVIQQTPSAQNYYQTHSVKNISPPILSRKRPNSNDHIEFATENKRVRKSEERISRGLRHFSMKVCEKVKEKITTTYNEVADDLVREFTTQQGSNSPLADQYDQKNIRRRVYDALNVLMAMNIISKEKKEIRWIGLPTNSAQECQELQKEVQKKIASIKEKEKQFRELIINQIAFKSLAQRNKETEKLYGAPEPNSFIQLPFIVINTNKKTVINCSISNDKMEYLLQFSDKFEINDDLEILKQIGMLHGLDTGNCSPEDLQKIKTLIPESLWPYVEKLATGSRDPMQEFLNSTDPCSSSMTQMADLVETRLEEIISRPSSSIDLNSDELDTDLSSDEMN